MKLRILFLLWPLITACASTQLGDLLSPAPIKPVRVAESYDAVFAHSVAAASMVGWDILHTDQQAGVISAKTHATATTYSAAVTVTVTEGDQGVTVEAVGTNQHLLDWDKGQTQIRRFYVELNKLMPAN